MLLYGEQHFTNRFTTEASVTAITREDLVAFHRRYFHPANMIAAVSGAVLPRGDDPQAGGGLRGLAGRRGRRCRRCPREIAHRARPASTASRRTSTRAASSIGLPAVRRDSPDVYALEVMNEILGGVGFTSRITRTVRSNEGLAYSAGSGLALRRLLPGRASAPCFQSKSRTRALRRRSWCWTRSSKIREAPVTDEELDTVKRNLIETFPSNFASKAQTHGDLRRRRVHAARPRLLADLSRPHPRR